MSNKTNSIHAKLHLACFNPKRKDAFLVNAALQYVFIDDGMAIAANGSMVVGIDLKSHGISQNIIDHLNGNLIHAKHWKMILGKTIKDNNFNESYLNYDEGSYVPMTKNGVDGLNYPNFKTALPWFTWTPANVELLPDFKIDLNLMNIINDCLNPDGDIFAIQLFLFKDNKIIRIMPLDDNDTSFVMMTSIKSK